MVFPGWIIVVLASWTGLGGRLVEEEGRSRLGTVDERKENRWQDGRGALVVPPGISADGRNLSGNF